MLLNPWAASRNVIYSVFSPEINLFKDTHHSVYFPEQQKVSKATWRLLLLWNGNQVLLSPRRKVVFPGLVSSTPHLPTFGGKKWKHVTDLLMLLCLSMGKEQKLAFCGKVSNIGPFAVDIGKIGNNHSFLLCDKSTSCFVFSCLFPRQHYHKLLLRYAVYYLSSNWRLGWITSCRTVCFHLRALLQ